MGTSESKAQAIDIMYVGLDNSGKSTLIKQILGEQNLLDTSPTLGYDCYSYYFSKQQGCKNVLKKFNLVDLGGHERIRAIWKNYYGTSLGIVFVFDASDAQKAADVKKVFAEVVEQADGKHILVCANKQDL